MSSVHFDSPSEHNHKVHDVPAVPQVGALMQCKTQGQDFDSRLKAEDCDEVGLRLLLQERTGEEGRRKQGERMKGCWKISTGGEQQEDCDINCSLT